MRLAEFGIMELQKIVDTQIIIPNQNLFRVANEKTTFANAFAMPDQVLYSGVACITDLTEESGREQGSGRPELGVSVIPCQ
jgi:cell division protein FtsZ